MPQYQLNPDPGAGLRSLLERLFGNRRTFADPSAGRQPGTAIPNINTRNTPDASPLSRMIPAISTNNAAAGGGIYGDVGLPSMSVGGGTPPTINQPGVSAIAVDRRPLADRLPAPEQSLPEPSLSALMPAAAAVAPSRRPRRAPGYDTAAMDYLTSSIVEGQNANIDDDTRARALAWALRNNPE